MASLLYLKGIEQFMTGDIASESDTLKAAFMAPAYTANAGTHQFYSDVSGNVAAGSTDQTLTNVSINIDTGNSRVEFDCDNLSVSNETTTTDSIIIYKDTGNAATSPLIAYLEFTEGSVSPVDGTLAVTFNVEGLFSIAST